MSEIDDDAFNMSMRKFLKKVGVTSQQEIEKAVRAAAEKGALTGPLSAKVVVSIEGVGLAHTVEGAIALKSGQAEE